VKELAMSAPSAATVEDGSCGPCRGLDRREFLERTLLAAAAGFLAGCAAGGPTVASLTPVTIHLANYPALANVGGIAVIDNGYSNGVPWAVARTGQSSFVALSLICPHRGGMVQSLGTSFMCPVHGAQFSGNGTWTGGQPTSSLGRYTVQYDATAGTLAVS
jgi:nitrite reductase/ring-hydroxylating ferredoxin subunit